MAGHPSGGGTGAGCSSDLSGLRKDFAAFAQSSLTESRISIEPAETDPAGRDARGLYSGPVIAVAAPGTTRDVSRLLAYCNERAIPVVPQGGNTSSSGGSVPLPDAPAVIRKRCLNTAGLSG